jgi:hypothetical protein
MKRAANDHLPFTQQQRAEKDDERAPEVREH